ncbi:MAG: YggT family protein [Ardenticatenales bacterium]|nr:YggT family protein [Ardenticatenales bacterium]
MYSAVNLIFNAIFFLIFIRILLSWLPLAGIRIDEYNPIVQGLIRFTDIFLEPFRRLIPPVSGMDFSPIVAILVLQFAAGAILGLIPR